MRTLLAHRNRYSGTNRQKYLAILALSGVFLMIFAGSLFAGGIPLTHTPGRPSTGKSHNIPTHPSAKTLSRVALKPDLTVEKIRISQKGRGKAEAVITIKNAGKGTSSAARASVILIRGNKTKAKGTLRVKTLKAGEATTLHWHFRPSVGSNTVKVTVNGKSLEKTFFDMAPAPKALAPQKAIQAAGARRALSAKHPVNRGVLVVQKVLFDDLKTKKPGESRVTLSLKNAGGKATPARTLRIEIKRADGTRGWRALKVRALRPHESIRLETTLRMTPGINTLTIPGIGGMAPRPVTTFAGASRFFFTRHVFNPRLFTAVKRNNAALANQDKSHGRAVANPDTFKVLSPGKHVTLPKQAKITTYDAQVAAFTSPRQNAVIAPNTIHIVAWSIPNSMENGLLTLSLTCLQGDPNMPVLFLARDMDPAARSYSWDVGNLPEGKYELQLAIRHAGGIHLIHTDFFISYPHLHISQKSASPMSRYIGKSVTVQALVTNSGQAVPNAHCRVAVYGPWGFQAGKEVYTGILSPDDPRVPLTFTFSPPYYGMYRAVFEPDVNHQYPHATQGITKDEKTLYFAVSPLPDLPATINKVADHGSVGTSHFHIRVKNIGVSDAPETTVVFYIWDPDTLYPHTVHKTYDIPRLGPGATWEHEYTHRWYGTTGTAQYRVTVDPDNHIQEINEDNNRVDDTLEIYPAGMAHSTTSSNEPVARLVVTKVIGLEQVVAGKHVTCTLSFQNQTTNRSILPPTRVTILPTSFFKSGHNQFDIPELYPGETFNLILDGEFENAGNVAFRAIVPGYQNERFSPHTERTVYEKPIVVAENTGISSGEAEAVVEALGWRNSFTLPGNTITVLSPGKNRIWSVGRTYQIAWTGDATGHFTVTLIPKDHPDASIQIADNVSELSMNYTVSNNLANGLYRIKVQGKNGRGVSDLFTITTASKPNLKLKAVSLTDRL